MEEETLVFEVERPSTLHFNVRAISQAEAESFVDDLDAEVGTFMIDTNDWRFKENEYLTVDTERIVEIFGETD